MIKERIYTAIQMLILQHIIIGYSSKKGKIRHQITQLNNFRNCNKTPINPYWDRADSRFPHVTTCDKKCNILNKMMFYILLM